MSVAEKAIVYASLILADDNVEITADNLATITKAANVQIDAIYFDLFAKALAGRNISDMLMNVGSAAAAPAAAAPAAGDAGAAPAAAEAAAPEPEEESDDDMGFGLFD